MSKKIGKWIKNNSLWIVSVGLMMASTGIDGVYMTYWMVSPWEWSGLLINLCADITSQALMYWYTRLQRGSNMDKRKLSRWLLVAEVAAIAYSWFFSWRQLRKTMPTVEPQDWEWVAPIAAGFVPLMLVAIALTQGLRHAAKIEEDEEEETLPRTQPEPEVAEIVQPVAQPAPEESNQGQRLPRPERIDAIKLHLGAAELRGEHITDKQLGDLFGVSRQQAGKDRAVALEIAGNGNGRGNGS